MSMNAQSGPARAFFDFAQTNSLASWQIVNDDVMGGVSSSQLEWRNGTATFSGEVSLKNNGGFASIRTLPVRHDLADRDTFVIRVRGDGQRYKFTVRTTGNFNGVVYQATFETVKDQWQEHHLPFKDFVPTFRGRILDSEPPLDPASVTSVGFLISDQQAGPFQLEMAWIKASRSRQP